MRHRIITLIAGLTAMMALLTAPRLTLQAQENGTEAIQSMRWGSDYKLHVSLGNNSSYIVDIRALHHEQGNQSHLTEQREARYWPVTLDKDFVESLKSKPITLGDPSDSSRIRTEAPRSYTTLWSALHADIGGGYVHLLNCIIYALEAGHLQLDHVIMQRPISSWRPDPITESYRRTRKWRYYVPSSQREAKREYKLRLKEGTLQDLQGIPQDFIALFLNTSDRGYRRMAKKGERDRMAQIDLVRMMVGAKYLGVPQIQYVSQCVRNAITTYTASNLPSVIIFDDYQAAVAMQLDREGYRIDYIVFQNQQDLSREEVARRESVIRQLVQNINAANADVFRARLKKHYE